MKAENETPLREPLDPAALRRAAIRPGGLWHQVEVVESTGSTNADLLARARDGEPEGTVLVTEHQQAGRGRMGRTWITPPRAALTFSLLVRPETVPPARRGWLPLLTGVAVTEAITDVTGVPATLKWPNDVLAAQGKLVGILAEAAADAIVVGIGLNVSTAAAELPDRGPGALPAASLLTAGAKPGTLDRGRLLLAILDAFERRYLAWCAAAGDQDRSGLRAAYVERSGTIGRQVRAELPGGQALSGSAVGVDADGRLLVRSSAGTVSVAAADVVHLR
ncbi:MAG: biotin--[acetyl-CoA-carboxylase] ligase [Streptosporangiaceae bacterium]|jgi:BirA family biotin operon repressor/biotin-[acetyl-CoA-carboxylase] ligase